MRIAPRALVETASTRVDESRATSQSTTVVPRKRAGDIPVPVDRTMGYAASIVLRSFEMIPVCAGKRPDMIVECPGPVSVSA